MASLNMSGPFTLDKETVSENITRTSAGNYALGRVDSDKKFIVSYVGRSDDDVAKRLKKWIDDGTKHSQFKYSYATSPKNAFERECKNYHDFGESEKLDNKIHPARPKDSNWKCPICNIFDE